MITAGRVSFRLSLQTQWAVDDMAAQLARDAVHEINPALKDTDSIRRIRRVLPLVQNPLGTIVEHVEYPTRRATQNAHTEHRTRRGAANTERHIGSALDRLI
jgi:hypothetical protein